MSGTTDDGDGLEIASVDDFRVTRKSGTSRPDPVTERIPGTDQALRVIPPTNGQLESWGDALESDDPAPETLAEMFNECLADIAEGDAEPFTAAEIEGDDEESAMLGYTPLVLREVIKSAGGYDFFLGVQRRTQERLAKLMEGLDQDEMLNGELSDSQNPPASENTS